MNRIEIRKAAIDTAINAIEAMIDRRGESDDPWLKGYMDGLEDAIAVLNREIYIDSHVVS